MTRHPIIGNHQVLDRFATGMASGRLASTWLLVGPEGTGKNRMARYIASCLLCEGSPATELAACGKCPACQQVNASTHPDLLEIKRPPGKSEIPVKLLIGRREHRMREGLCYDLSLKPFRGGKRIAIIDDADFLNQEGANSLLKTLEEPPSHALIFLIATSEQRQLPTIRSRSQIARFQPLSADEVTLVLNEQNLDSESRSVEQLALASGGSPRLAMQLASDGAMEFRQELLERLATLDPTDGGFPESVTKYVAAKEVTGKEASAVRRDRLRLVADLATRFFRQLMLELAGQSSPTDQNQQQAVAAARSRWCHHELAAAACIERCVAVRIEIAANVNHATLIECWLSDLGRLMRGENPG